MTRIREWFQAFATRWRDPVLWKVVTIVGYPDVIGMPATSSRCVAVCTTLERARQIVETNEGDIFETVYRYVVVEAMRANWLYGGFEGGWDGQHWYQWQQTEGDDVGRYIRMKEPPAQYERVVGFGVG